MSVTTLISTPTPTGFAVSAWADLNNVGDAMAWTRFEMTDITAQISGTATTGTVVVERSARDPGPNGASASAAPADETGLTGNLATGVVPNVYVETGVGWWRIRATTVTGGQIIAALSGTSLK